jgi:hypothetical protein
MYTSGIFFYLLLLEKSDSHGEFKIGNLLTTLHHNQFLKADKKLLLKRELEINQFQQLVDIDAVMIDCNFSLLLHLLPVSLVRYLIFFGPVKFDEAFHSTSTSPNIIWGDSMRQKMREVISAHVLANMHTIHIGQYDISVYHFPGDFLPPIDYIELKRFTIIDHYYIEPLNDAAFQDFKFLSDSPPSRLMYKLMEYVSSWFSNTTDDNKMFSKEMVSKVFTSLGRLFKFNNEESCFRSFNMFTFLLKAVQKAIDGEASSKRKDKDSIDFLELTVSVLESAVTLSEYNALEVSHKDALRVFASLLESPAMKVHTHILLSCLRTLTPILDVDRVRTDIGTLCSTLVGICGSLLDLDFRKNNYQVEVSLKCLVGFIFVKFYTQQTHTYRLLNSLMLVRV